MLKPRKRLTRREIKEDPLVTQYVKYQKMLKTYSRHVNIGLIAIAAIVVISVLVSRSKKNAEIHAEGDLVMAEQVYMSRDFERAPAELKKVSDDYPGTEAAGRAVFFRANALFHKGDFESAQIAFQEYVDDYGQIEMFLTSSLAGVAACEETKENYADAAALYHKAAKRNMDAFDAVYHLKSAARCYRMADMKDKAKDLYESILEKYPDSPVLNDVKFWMATI